MVDTNNRIILEMCGDEVDEAVLRIIICLFCKICKCWLLVMGAILYFVFSVLTFTYSITFQASVGGVIGRWLWWGPAVRLKIIKAATSNGGYVLRATFYRPTHSTHSTFFHPRSSYTHTHIYIHTHKS